MADFAATAGKTDDMTHANAKIVPPARHENRMAARAYALVMRWLVRLAALITVAILVFLIGYILVNGIPNLKPSLFEWTYNSDNVSLMPALINTILMTAFSLAIATPLQQAMRMLAHAWMHLWSLTVAVPKLKAIAGDIAGEKVVNLVKDNMEAAFYYGKILSARFYLGSEFKHFQGYLDYITSGEQAVVEAFEEIFTGALPQ